MVNKKSVAIIPNAQDFFAKKDDRVNHWIHFFKENMYTCVEVIDLTTISHEKLLDKLLEFKVVYVIGGNTFHLLSMMKDSGFEKILSELLEFGVVYSGHSAGAAVMGSSIIPLKYADNPELGHYSGEEGLCYLDFVFLPHADNSNYADNIKRIKKDFSKDYKIIFFNDDQGLIFDEKTKEITYF